MLFFKIKRTRLYNLAKISMVAELQRPLVSLRNRCSLAKISMVAEHENGLHVGGEGCSLAKFSICEEHTYELKSPLI